MFRTYSLLRCLYSCSLVCRSLGHVGSNCYHSAWSSPQRPGIGHLLVRFTWSGSLACRGPSCARNDYTARPAFLGHHREAHAWSKQGMQCLWDFPVRAIETLHQFHAFISTMYETVLQHSRYSLRGGFGESISAGIAFMVLMFPAGRIPNDGCQDRSPCVLARFWSLLPRPRIARNRRWRKTFVWKDLNFFTDALQVVFGSRSELFTTDRMGTAKITIGNGGTYISDILTPFLKDF